jgi:suppressor for copper-sensitivity B
MQARKFLLTIFLIIFASNAFAGLSDFKTDFKTDKSGKAQARIVANFYEENGEKKLIAGFEIKINKGWKIYAPDDSGFGLPPSFNLSGSENIKTTDFKVNFPASIIQKEELGSEIIEYKVYEKQVLIPFELKLIDPSQDVNLQVTIDYGICKEICIPTSQTFSLSIPASGAVAAENIDNKEQSNSGLILQLTLFKALIIAFIGGAILNVMPCVLPVLSIKLLSIINHSKSAIGRIRLSFLSTIIGIIFSFLVFALIAVSLKSVGQSVGWGFQFQNSYFLIFLLLVLMIFIANLLGLFEFNFNSNLSNSLGKKIDSGEKKNNIFWPNFFSGILAVLLATPCSAPFVGVAVSFALGSDFKSIFLIFIAMSLGLSLPYLILIIFPKSVRLMPKPGIWMVAVKKLMAFFLALTALWLIYILVDNIGFLPAISAGLLAILILPFFRFIKSTNLFDKLKVGRGVRIFFTAGILTLILGSSFVVPNGLTYLSKMMEKSQVENWIKFDESQIDNLITEGKVVVVDITADWCITCKANKILVLNSDEIRGFGKPQHYRYAW